MDKKVTGIIAYLTLIGWLIAYLAGDKEGAKFHLNQALVLAICNIANIIVGMIPLIGGILSSIISIIILILTKAIEITVTGSGVDELTDENFQEAIVTP